MKAWIKNELECRPLLLGFVLVFFGALLTIFEALFFEKILGLQPCHLCLEQRQPYYLVMPISAVFAIATIAKLPKPMLVAGDLAIAALMLYSAWLGLHHAGVEWKWWAGPADCSGAIEDYGAAGNLLSRLQNIQIVRCDDAPWRLFGLSLAGYNFFISLGLTVISIVALELSRRKAPKRSR